MKTKLLQKTNNPILNANNRHVRFNGQLYRIHVQRLGSFTLADAELIQPAGSTPFNRFGRNKLAQGIRSTVEAGLFS